MPYVAREARDRIDAGGRVGTPGELNYAITMLCDRYVFEKGKSYTFLNDVIGVLECAKQEFYRRVAAPYEDEKIRQNGDVYSRSDAYTPSR